MVNCSNTASYTAGFLTSLLSYKEKKLKSQEKCTIRSQEKGFTGSA